MPSSPTKILDSNDPNVVRIQQNLNTIDAPFDKLFDPKFVRALFNEADIRKLPRNSMFTIIFVISSLFMAGYFHLSLHENHIIRFQLPRSIVIPFQKELQLAANRLHTMSQLSSIS